jgi:chloramphenicol-sensitive protein RarD
MTDQKRGGAGDAGAASAGAAGAGGLSLRAGLLSALGCYVLWGLLPLYWKLLAQASYFEILSHRMLWSFVFMLIICRFVRRVRLSSLLRERRALLILGGAGLLICGNWGLYIYAINSGHVLQASLGYYINPLVAILFGVLFFRERLTTIQKVATLLAAAGVVYFTVDYGSFPWIALALAVTFAIYGALKKYGGYPATPALTVETLLVAPLALVFVAATFFLPNHVFLTELAPLAPSLAQAAVPAVPAPLAALAPAGSFDGWALSLLLIGGGALTAIPLLLFARAANAIPLTWVGFLQYISPTLTLLLGVFVYGEPFTTAHAVCFALIWTGLILVSAELIHTTLRR